MESLKQKIRESLVETGCNTAPGLTIEDLVNLIDRIMSHKSYVNIDFNDVAHVLKNSSVVNIASAKAAYDQIGNALSPMLRADQPGHKLSNVIIHFTIGPDFTMEHITKISDVITSLAPEINVIWGVSNSDTLTGEAEISVILGFN